MSEQVSYLPVEMLVEMKKQTEILERMERQQGLLIQALAEEQGEDPDAPPMTYMDGSKVI
ncbi:hypothetical protein [Pseudomonas brenneri]|uniref:hypothetical protein n=1 Tax=Pseudomonas brenneri TaxID=129817 RepID=UPI0028D83FBF|nr:hypothetical protein [Pseudomonas brenneri]